MKSFKAAVIVGALGVTLAGCTAGTPAAEQPPTAPSTSTSPATQVPPASDTKAPAPTTSAAAASGVLDPGGFGAIRLGMTAEQLVATGLVEGPEGQELCELYRLKSGEGSLWLQKDGTGVASIGLDRAARTPEGITFGSTAAEVRAAYPTLREGVSWSSVDRSGDTGYGFSGDPVTKLLVFKRDQGCHN
ncbi:hypothetical protein ABZ816_14365 [Actinosynnema sp. NPDC047251]